MRFINRQVELKELEKWSQKHSMIVLFGRRRVGKTCLITYWLNNHKGNYSQAIEGTTKIQIKQVISDLQIETSFEVANWIQFFELIEKISEPTIICIDEFPYLVDADPSLPSIMQKWWDHRKNKKITIILSGSSQKMMHSCFLNEAAPLFGRASRILKVEPMSYAAFCKGCDLKPQDQESFLKYSMVGGIPKYWEYVSSKAKATEIAEALYFSSGSILENEPRRILTDEKVEGLIPLSLLEVIGRGVHRPSEISSRLGVQQSSLSKSLALLVNASLIVRETPFGFPPKDSKKSLYKIVDPMMAFWFSVYSPLRSQWKNLSEKEKINYIYLHASRVFEEEVRRTIHTGSRYWSDKEEIDILMFSSQTQKLVTAVEVKFTQLAKLEREKLSKILEGKMVKACERHSWKPGEPIIFDWKDFVAALKNSFIPPRL